MRRFRRQGTVTQKHTVRSRILLTGVALGLAGCGLVDANVPMSYPQPASTPITPSPHRRMILVGDCFQDDARYPRPLFHQALDLTTRSVEEMVQDNADGGVVYLTLVNGAQIRPEDTVSVLTIPPTPPLPRAPTLTPTPTVDANNPYASAAAQATADAREQSATQEYLSRLGAAQAQVVKVQTQVHQWATHVRALNPPLGQGIANLGQCIALASHRFNNWQGEKYLVIAGTLASPGGETATWYSLAGVHIRWLAANCPDIADCASGEDAWAQALSAAGASDHLFYDPGETRALSDLFGAPAGH